MLRIAPRDPVEQAAVEKICDDLECLLHACGGPAGKNPRFHLLIQRHEIRLQTIIRRALARIETLHRLGPQKEFAKIALVEPPPNWAS